MSIYRIGSTATSTAFILPGNGSSASARPAKQARCSHARVKRSCPPQDLRRVRVCGLHALRCSSNRTFSLRSRDIGNYGGNGNTNSVQGHPNHSRSVCWAMDVVEREQCDSAFTNELQLAYKCVVQFGSNDLPCPSIRPDARMRYEANG